MTKNVLIIGANSRIAQCVKGGFKLLFYGGLKMYDLGGLRIDWCQSVWLPFDLDYMWVIYKSV